jgi:hypothetical protein
LRARLADADIRRPLGRRQIRRVDVGDGPAQGKAVAQQIAEGLKDAIVDGLVRLVVCQGLPDGVGG